MKLKTILVASLSLSLFGCGGSSGSNGSAEDLGPQIDAMGRAAVNTALIMTFAPDAARSAAEDDFNATSNEARSRFSETIGQQLAIYDALVGECGDNPVTNRASANPADGLASGGNRYALLSSVLADDQLYVNASSGGAAAGQCNQYLAVEFGVLGTEGLGADCGGRTPNHDTIQTTYSVVAAGAATGVDDGISSDTVAHSLTEFPFLAPAS